MPRAASSVGVGRRVKRETALASYNDLDARHTGDGVILLVGLRSYDAHLSVTFPSDMQRTPKLCYSGAPAARRTAKRSPISIPYMEI